MTDIPVLIMGTGFEIPPFTSPLPSFRPWQNIPPAAHQNEEHCLVQQINRLLTSAGKPKLTQLPDLYQASPVFLTTFPELDPFGERPGMNYIGPCYALPETPRVSWQTTDRPHIVAYLRPTLAEVENVLAALQNTRAEVTCAMPGLPSDWVTTYPNLHFYPHPVDLLELLPQAQLMICAGASSIGVALQAGVPVLHLPEVTEQLLTGMALERYGAGRMVKRPRTVEQMEVDIKELLEMENISRQTQGFLAKYSSCTINRINIKPFTLLNNLIKQNRHKIKIKSTSTNTCSTA